MSARMVSGWSVASPAALRLAGWLAIAFSLVSLLELPAIVQSLPTPPIWTISLDTLRPLVFAYSFWVFKDFLRRRSGLSPASIALWTLIVVGILQVPIQGAPLWSNVLGMVVAFPGLSLLITVLYGVALIGLGVALRPRDLYGLTRPLGILLILAGVYPFFSLLAGGLILSALVSSGLGPSGAIYVLFGLGSALVAAPMVVLGVLLLRAGRS